MLKIRKIKNDKVYDITVEDNHNFYGNGILVHNCTEIGVPIFPIRGISIKRNIHFKYKEDRDEYYKLRTECYYHSDNDKEIHRYQIKMQKLYSFTNEDLTAEVDESKDYDYFDLFGYVNLSEVGVCILGGVNMGYCSDDRLPIVSEFLVRLLEEIIDYGEYSAVEVEKAAKMRRTLGIGFSDIFHLMAKNKKFYNTREGRQFLSNRIELCAYHMTRTSIDLAKERGPCQLVSDTKYHDGIMPIDTYEKTVDELVGDNEEFALDWELLRSGLLKYGIRHSTLMANAPFGSSAMVSNSTSGIEPPRGLATTKKGTVKLVPDIKKYGKYYTTAWGDDFNNIDYFKFIAVAQKWMDQTISVNEYHNLLKTNGKKKKTDLIEGVLTHRYYGGKTLYYSNIRSTDQADGDDGIIEEESDVGCAGGGCIV